VPRVSARAAILVTGTEVLGGRVSDSNGPWLSERLGELGVDVAQITIVGDRPDDMRAALEGSARLALDLVVTSGGLGPTEDDLTARVVGEWSGRAMVLDDALEEQIAEILRPMLSRWPHLSAEAIRASNRKQAVVPEGATILAPVGTAPGLVVTPAEGRAGPTVVVLPGPPRELQALWLAAVETEPFARAVAGRTPYEQRMLRLYGLPESEIAETLCSAADAGVAMDELEITTCLRRGEIEIVTRFAAGDAAAYEAFAAIVRARHGAALFSDDFSLIDDQVAAMLLEKGLSVAVAESCTGGLLAARLTERPGASAYVAGGVVAYSDHVKESIVGVAHELLAQHGAVSAEAALALADGARARFGAEVGIGVTGIAGPGGGSEGKPVGTVWVALRADDGRQIVRRALFPGSRSEVRERTTTLAMHLLRRLLLGEDDGAAV
jgi:nicotinamide-nucleotide amidase